MAKLAKNSPLQGLRGKIGDYLFRQVQGETIVSQLPAKRKKKPSSLQSYYQDKFTDASRYAKAITRTPEGKAKYKEIATRLGLPNAYTAALKEYLQQATIESIDDSNYTGTAGDEITIKADKNDFPITEVVVTLTDGNNIVIEEGKATKHRKSAFWTYKAQKDFEGVGPVKITAIVHDIPGNIVTREVIIK